MSPRCDHQAILKYALDYVTISPDQLQGTQHWKERRRLKASTSKNSETQMVHMGFLLGVSSTQLIEAYDFRKRQPLMDHRMLPWLHSLAP